MRFSLNFIALIALLGFDALAAPIISRQGAGVGAGCDSIVSDADTMIGDASRGTGYKIASALARRQGAGVGAACNYIVSDADTMIGDASRGTGYKIADMISERQLNGIADGVTAVTGKVPGLESTSEELDTNLNDIDGYGTTGSANLGQTVGDAEVQLGESVGGSQTQSGSTTTGGTTGGAGAGSPPPPPPGPHPKRQLNGIADGITAVTAKVPGAAAVSGDMDSYLNTVDGQGTDDSAETGHIIGDEEVRLGQSIGGGQAGGPTTGP